MEKLLLNLTALLFSVLCNDLSLPFIPDLLFFSCMGEAKKSVC